MRKFYLFVLLFSLMYVNPMFAQPGWNLKENNVWPCIMDSALDFNSGSPVKVKSGIPVYWCSGLTNMVSFASVCDKSGNLLFYSDGDSVWGKNHLTMPNGYITARTSGSSQGLQIVPVLNNPNQYYLFSLDGPLNYVLSYSIIDLSLNHGLGDIVAGKKNIPIDSGLTDAVIATPGNNCDIWLISHDASDTLFKSYHITTDGIDTQVVQSRAGVYASFYSFLFSNMAVSPDRRKLAFAGWGLSANQAVELFDFDANTGKISNTLVLDSNTNYSLFPYGVCFSPDNTKLYFTSSDTGSNFWSTGIQPYIGYIHQYEINLSSPAAIVSSGVQLSQQFYYFWGTMISPPLRLGPDGKIYLPADDAYCPPEVEPNDTIPYIGCINSPNLKGNACNFQPHAIVVSSPPASALSPSCATGSPLYIPGSELLPYALGADYVKPLIGDSAYVRKDTTICLPLQDSIVLHAPSGYYEYKWNDGNTDSVRKIWNAGTYYVHAQTYCHVQVDTFVINEVNEHFSLGPDTVFCRAPFPYKLAVSLSSGTHYLWQDGNTNDYYIVTKSGLYSLTANYAQCKSSDSVQIAFIDGPHLGNDTAICDGEPVQMLLDANVPEGGIAIWNDGSFDNTLLVKDTGVYWVTMTDGPCQFSDTITVSGQLCDCAIEIPSAFSPNGDGRNDMFRPIIQPGCEIRRYKMEVYNRWGQMIYQSYRPQDGWNGTFNGVPQEIGAYQYIIRFAAGTKENNNFRKGDITLIR
ncbi:MAG: gliding motility-associated C-terminal domain-containing protein [Flavipsychrobacter sp.]